MAFDRHRPIVGWSPSLHRWWRHVASKRRAPYYVVAPPYDERSAGNRVLYALASRLRALGEESFVVVHPQWESRWAAVPARYDARPLTPELAVRHQRHALPPICVYPEITRSPADYGIRILYLLNHLGAMPDQATLSDYGYVMSYSASIARRSPRSDLTLHLPVSDPEYWSPGVDTQRSGAAVYAGKYVDLYGQVIPPDLANATVIARHGQGALSRDELRALFRRTTHLYVFESTALAAEAVLCGCPVVSRPNAHFDGHIGASELGSAGFATSDDAAAVAAAAAGTGRFRERYLAAISDAEAPLRRFVEDTQAMATAAPACATPYPVRPLARQG